MSRLEDEARTKPMFQVLVGLQAGSLRYIEQIVHRATMVFASIPDIRLNPMDTSEHMWLWKQLALTLMILRETDEDTYNGLTQGTIDAFDAGESLRRNLHSTDKELVHQMELVLLVTTSDKPFGLYQGSIWHRYVLADRKDDMNALSTEFEELRKLVYDDKPQIEHLANIIELTSFDPVAQLGSRFALDGEDGRILLTFQRRGELTGTSEDQIADDRVTVVVEPEDPLATVVIDPPDAQPSTPGHQIELPLGVDTTITVTTTTKDGMISTFRFTAKRSP